MEQEIKKLQEELKTLKERVNRLDGLDRKYLPDTFNPQLIKTINDNMIVFGTVTFSDANPIEIPISGVTPENIVLNSFGSVSYIKKSNDGLQNILYISAGDIGASCNYIVFKTTKVPTSY